MQARSLEEIERNEAHLPLWWYAQLVSRLCPQGGRLFEYGCGTGGLLKALPAQFEACGYDPLPSARHRCRLAVQEAMIVEEWEDLLPDAFDIIVAVDTLQVSQPFAVLNRLTVKLAKDGMLFLVVPNPSGVGHWWKRVTGQTPRQVGSGELRTYAQWAAMLRRAGLEVGRAQGDGLWDVPYVPFVPSYAQRAVLSIPTACQYFLPFRGVGMPTILGENLVLTAYKR